MPRFRYKAFTSAGDLAQGDMEGLSARAIEDVLWARGLTPFETREVGAGATADWRTFLHDERVRLGELASFTREFATLADASLPLDRCLRILASQASGKSARRLAGELLKKVLDGGALSQALAAHSDIFPVDFQNIVRAGEATGKLAMALDAAADMLERRVEMRARLQAALVYPALLLTLALVSTAIVIGVLAPSIAPIFADSGRPMPGGLAFVIALGERWPWLVGVAIAAAAGFVAFRQRLTAHPGERETFDELKLRTPIVGAWLARHESAKFCRALGAMLRAGVPMLAALAAARPAFTNAYFAARAQGAIEAVRGGEALSRAFAAIPQFPEVATQIIAVGEEARNLDVMLTRVAAMFERQVQRRIEQGVALLTPMLTILIAALVGSLVLSVMNAVLSINDLAMQ